MKKPYKKTFPGVFVYWTRRIGDYLLLWLLARLLGLFLALFLSFPFRKRMSHDNGIAATGKLRIVSQPDFPAHAFFAPGREFPLRIRHGSATFLDDAMNCIRSMAIKLDDTRFESPFDLEMNTGETSLFWSAASFMKFARLRGEKYGVEYRDYNRQYPDGLEASKRAGRRHATSFSNLHYYCKTPFLFEGDDGLKRYAKYRVVPADGTPQSGVEKELCDWDQCNQRVLPFETRGRNFLKYEYEDRIQKSGACYLLQIQLHPASEDEDSEVFNNMVVWDEDVYPWKDLAIMTIDQTLDWEESTLTAFSVNNMPDTLGILPARSIYDYNSLNYLRAHAEIARKARLLSYKVFGMVPPIPDNKNRNISDWGK